MIKKLCLSLFILLSNLAWGQLTGELKGRVTEEDTSLGIPFANVVLLQNGTMVNSQATDIDGYYHFKNVAEGTYSISFSGAGLSSRVFPNVQIKSNTTLILNSVMKSGIELKEYTILTNKNSNSSFKRMDTEYTISPTDIKRIPSSMGENDIVQSLLVTPGVVSSSNFQGSRANSEVFIDGIKIRSANTTNPEMENEEYTTIEENHFQSTTLSPLSTFSADVDRASYTVVRRYLKEGMLPPKNSIRIEEMINYFEYDYAQPKPNEAFSIQMEMSVCPWNAYHQVVSVGIQAEDIDPSRIPASNLVMLIDVSGSMSSQDKLPLVKTSLKLLVNQLRKEDKIALVVYAGNAGLVLSATGGDEKIKIMNAIDNLEAGGSTAGGQGIQLAYKIAGDNLIKNGNNRVVLCTDGDFNVGVSSEKELEDLIVSERDKGIFLTVLGYGTGNYKDSKMEVLADKGNGNYSYIDSQLEAEKVLVKEMVGTMFTVAKDVKFQVEFNPAVVHSYRLIGYENRALQNWEFNDDKRDAGEVGAGHTVTVLYEVELTTSQQTTGKDSLKYQAMMVKPQYAHELLTLKIRYKPRDKNESVLLESVLENHVQEFSNASENHRLACTVAEFGMFLRDSEFKGTTSLPLVLEQAKACRTFDEEGFRAEFVTLVKAAESLCKL